MKLRIVFLINGWLMMAYGVVLWGWHAPLARYFGILDWKSFNVYKATSFGGLLGGAMMALGFASFAIARSRDARFHRTAAIYFLVGYGFFGFIVWAKQLSLWRTPAGFLLLDAVAIPFLCFFFFAIAEWSPFSGNSSSPSDQEERIREIAGQEERYRLAQDLHDSVKQQIFSIHTNLATAQARWDTDQPGAREAIDHARSVAREAITEMSALLDRLGRDPLESTGLVEALRRQCESVGFQTGAEVTTHFGHLPSPERYRSGAMTTLFRIAQEGLANVSRHARATKVELDASLDSATGEFKLRIQDNGCGFDVVSQALGMGIRNMRTRVEEFHGKFDIESAPGQGTVLTVGMPLPDPAAERWTRHVRHVVAAIVICVPVTAMMSIWPGSEPYLMPIVLISGAVLLFHVVMRERVEKANPQLLRRSNWHFPLALLWGVLLTVNILVVSAADSFLDRKLILLLIVEGALLLSQVYKWKKKKT